jgi:hypothetical protein
MAGEPFELRRRQKEKRQLLFALERTSRLEDDVGIQHQVEEKWQRFEYLFCSTNSKN